MSRIVDRTAGWLGIAFLLTLLGSEAALSLPDQDASAESVVAFYAEHGTAVIVLQIVGFVAALAFGLFAWRLRRVHSAIAVCGLAVAVAAALPGAITVLLALTTNPAAAQRYNELEPRGDDVLFVAIAVFAVATALALGRRMVPFAAFCGAVAGAATYRLLREAFGYRVAVEESVPPLLFLVLVIVLVVLCFRGFPAAKPIPTS